MKKLTGLVVAACLAVVASASAQTSEGQTPESTRDELAMHTLLGASFILHGADIAGSMYLIGKYPNKFHEQNPVLRPFQNHPTAFGAAKMGLAFGVNSIIITIHKEKPKTAIGMLIANDILMAYVVGRNYRTGQTVGVR